jgi:hypothetical protein
VIKTIASTTNSQLNQPVAHAQVASPDNIIEMSMTAIMLKPRPADFASSMGNDSGTPFPPRQGTIA